MFLFDQFRTSQQKYLSGNQLGEVKWKTFLNSNPAFGAESTAVIDNDGNFYFGSHSGIFYSLTKGGVIRWTFYTQKKIYGSPLIIKDKVFFGGGDGYFYALSCYDGTVIWMKDLKKGFSDNFKQKLLNKLIYFPYTFNFKRLLNMDTKCWSSPLRIEEHIYITAFGKGLYAFDTDGKELWSYDLGFPRYQLSGTTADEHNNIYCSARSGEIFGFTSKGVNLWRKMAMRGWHAWGNPSYNRQYKSLYFVFSKGEKRGCIYTTNLQGKLIWKQSLQGAIHGSVAISKNGEKLYVSDFAGYLYRINSETGLIEKKIKLSEVSRSLWTTPSIDSEEYVYISTKESFSRGKVVKLDSNLNKVWEFKTNKTLSVPIILENGNICFGSWDGYYYCVETL